MALAAHGGGSRAASGDPAHERYAQPFRARACRRVCRHGRYHRARGLRGQCPEGGRAGNVLLLHAGDFCQGTTYFSELHGDLEIQALNAMHYDVVTLGNHEFDNGLEDLGRRLSSLEMPVVVCNYDFSPFEAGKYVKPYVVLERAGLRIGVLGVLCDLKSMVAGDIAERVPEFPLVETVQQYADLLKGEEKCDLVIALTHIGYTEHNPGDVIDPVLCSKTRNIDLFVTGHSHTFLEEMVYHPNLDGIPVPVVQDGWMGVYMGQIDYRL
ncbi:MAG: metallophosphoesterase [Bacteroidales bacterium]|nr:metallophosphoesterase [Bacteroidales bacterium]